MKSVSGKITVLVMTFAMGLAALAAYQKYTAPLPPPPKPVKDTLRIGLMEPILSLHPNSFIPNSISSALFDQMVLRHDGQTGAGGYRNIALERMQVSADGKECLVTLRKGMLFHNGEEVTSADVAYSFRSQLSENTLRFLSSLKYEVLGKYIIRLVVDESADWGYVLGGDILNEDYEKEHKANLEGYIPMGSGPYKFVSYDKEKGIVKLERWEKYWAGPAPFKYVEFHSFPNSDAQTMALLEGRVDYGIYVNNEDINLIKVNDDIQILETEGMFLGLFTLNHKSPKLNDWRVRKALSLLIPREAIVASPNGLRGDGIATDTILNLIPPVTKPELVDGFSPEKAMRLLNEAGYKLEDGKMMRNGQRLTMVISFLENDVINALGPLRMVAQAWNENGILATLRAKDISDIMKSVQGNNYDAVFEYRTDWIWSGSFKQEVVRYDSAVNNAHYIQDGELEMAFDSFNAAQVSGATEKERLELKKQVQAQLRRISHIVPLFHTKCFFATRGLGNMQKELAMEPYLLGYIFRPKLAF
ncbi:MAG: ABC transporter substrate-binding protein [Nitrospinota bacterium]|nr:ABC transporter substrate-binding protein [Nitrospinota bacterium]